jgi:hypothetical protein
VIPDVGSATGVVVCPTAMVVNRKEVSMKMILFIWLLFGFNLTPATHIKWALENEPRQEIFKDKCITSMCSQIIDL